MGARAGKFWNPAASLTRRRAQPRCSFFVAACALRCPHAPTLPLTQIQRKQVTLPKSGKIDKNWNLD